MGPDPEVCEMELSKIQIVKLDGHNWISWKYRMVALLRGMDGLMDIVDGKTQRPARPVNGSGDAVIESYNKSLRNFVKLESTALLLITNNMTDETLGKVIRLSTPKEVWDELHRLYEGPNEGRLYDICLDFFKLKRDPSDDMSTHVSKLKNLWHSLKEELLKEEKVELPEVLLICKILDTLPEVYFSFKSSWLLMSKKERTVENITSQLCAHEKALNAKMADAESSETALYVKINKKVAKGHDHRDQGTKKKYKCFICKEPGHLKKDCPRVGIKEKENKAQGSNMMLLTVNSTDSNNDRDDWYVDNGATHHVTMRGDLFQDFKRFGEAHTVTTADGNVIQAVGNGTVHLKANVKDRIENLFLRDVWYVPQISKNLFSVLSSQDKNPTSVFESRVTNCSMKINGRIVVTGTRQRCGGLYKIDCKVVRPAVSVNLIEHGDMLQLYHERMGHQDKKHVKRLIKKELGIETPNSGELCEGCIFGKAHRQPFGVREKATKPGERIHSDVCGPFPSSISGYRYFVLFKDEYTRYRYVYFLKNKSDVYEKLKLMLSEARNAGHSVIELLSDNGGEYDNKRVRDLLEQTGIKQRLIMPYTPQQNGCSERENRTLVESARAMMHAHEEIPQNLWAELVNTAVYILNRTGPTLVELKSPYELWLNKKPQIKHLRIIGTPCYAHVPKQRRKKLHKKATRCILIGYDNDDGYRLWNRERNSLVRSRDVIFNEKMLESSMNERDIETVCDQYNEIEVVPVTRSLTDDEQSVPVEPNSERVEETDYPDISIDEGHISVGEEFHDAQNILPEQSIESGGNIIEEDNVIDGLDDGIDENQDYDDHEDVFPEQMVLRDRSSLRPPDRFKDFILNAIMGYNEPTSHKDAIRSPEKDLWEEAMDSEMNSLQENDTWKLVSLPKGRKAIPCKWVFRVKMNADGSIDKYKARLVIKGFHQKKGIDYEQTFSPVTRMGTVRSVLSVAANEGLVMLQFDVSTAFLYGSLNEEIFMKQPEGYNDGSGRVCLLRKSLYGLKQAPRCWNRCILDFFKEIGFKASEADPCLLIREKGCGKVIVALYVDDGLVAGSSQQLIDEFIKELSGRFKITTKPASYFLGIEIESRGDGIKIVQTSYVRKILRRFGMDTCKPVSTPIVKDGTSSEKVDMSYMKNNYRQIVGALAYLMVCTRPDIAYAVSVVSRSLEKPEEVDCVRLKRIMRYLQYTPDLGIMYKKHYKEGILECYSDADHAGDVSTGRSTSGVLCMYAGGAISWLSQRQASVAISTTEAEIVAASEAARETIWLARLLNKIVVLKNIPCLRVDNEAAIRLAENPEFHRRTKHIRVRHFFVRELVTSGELNVNKIASEEQLADIFTKPLTRARILKISNLIGLC